MTAHPQPEAAKMPTTLSGLYWMPDEENNRAFLCLPGVDNNVAEIYSVNSPDFLSAHDVACRMVKVFDAHACLLAENEALEKALERARFAFREYECEVDGDSTPKHRAMMREIEAALAASQSVNAERGKL